MSAEIRPASTFHMNSDSSTSPSNNSDPPVYPMPSDRVAKSASVVPKVVEATIVAQYIHLLNRVARICTHAVTRSARPNMAVPTK